MSQAQMLAVIEFVVLRVVSTVVIKRPTMQLRSVAITTVMASVGYTPTVPCNHSIRMSTIRWKSAAAAVTASIVALH